MSNDLVTIESGGGDVVEIVENGSVIVTVYHNAAIVGAVDETLQAIAALPPTPNTNVGRDSDGNITLNPIGTATTANQILSPSYPASVTLSALRVVTLDSNDRWAYADKDTSAHVSAALGLLESAVTVGNGATPVLQGKVADNSWVWDKALPIWLGANGVLTQTPPASGFLRQVATAIDSTNIFFSPQEGVAYGN